MKRIYVLYNPKSGNGTGKGTAQRLNDFFREEKIENLDVTAIKDYGKLFSEGVHKIAPALFK